MKLTINVYHVAKNESSPVFGVSDKSIADRINIPKYAIE